MIVVGDEQRPHVRKTEIEPHGVNENNAAQLSQRCRTFCARNYRSHFCTLVVETRAIASTRRMHVTKYAPSRETERPTLARNTLCAAKFAALSRKASADSHPLRQQAARAAVYLGLGFPWVMEGQRELFYNIFLQIVRKNTGRIEF